MAIRNIVKEGDPILNKVCRPVTNFDDRLATLLDDMRETMIAADGVGLAGPQVGMMRRLFVVWDTTDAPEEIPEDYEYKFIDFVNPEILAVSEEEETAYEGCLSFPGHNGAVTRPVAVKVRAQDRNGEWFELEADGLLGRCIQHENDHLDGITIMESSEFFYEDTEEGRAAAAIPHGLTTPDFCISTFTLFPIDLAVSSIRKLRANHGFSLSIALRWAGVSDGSTKAPLSGLSPCLSISRSLPFSEAAASFRSFTASVAARSFSLIFSLPPQAVTIKTRLAKHISM